MRAVSSTFLQTIRGAHRSVFRARILSPGFTGTNPGPLNNDGSPTNAVPVVSGNVVFDTKSDVNATLDILLKLDWPSVSTSLGAPYGQEVFVERGVKHGGGTAEWVGLGYFRIDSVEQDDAPKGLVRLSGSDRMASIRDARPLQPVQYTSGISVGAVIDAVVGDAFGFGITTVYDFSAYSTLLTSDHILEDDRIKFLNELTTAYGKIFYFDYLGRFVVKANPAITATPVFNINAGTMGVLCSMKRTISRDAVYNAVVATGEAVGEAPPVRGQALDLATTSPTYWFGPFGKVPRFFSSSFLTTSAQCDSAAASLLASSTGIPYVVDLGMVPNPALEGWDVVSVTYSDKVYYETHVLDTIVYPLAVEDRMTITTRKQFLT